MNQIPNPFRVGWGGIRGGRLTRSQLLVPSGGNLDTAGPCEPLSRCGIKHHSRHPGGLRRPTDEDAAVE